MAFGMYFISSEFDSFNQFKVASYHGGSELLTDNGNEQLWESLQNLPSSSVRRRETGCGDNDNERVMYSSYGTWVDDLFGPIPEADDGVSQRFLDYLINKFQEMSLFPDHVIIFDRWVSSNICAPPMDPNMAPLFRVILWRPPESDTLIFPIQSSGINNQVCTLLGKLSDSDKTKALVLLDEIRERKGWEKMEVIACSNVKQVTGTRSVHNGRLIIGGQPSTNPPHSILLPRGNSWNHGDSGSYNNLEAEGRNEIELGTSDFCLITPKTIWLLPLIEVENVDSLLYCLQGVSCFLDGAFEAFNTHYVSNRENGIVVSWENAFEALGPRLVQNLETQLNEANSIVSRLQTQLESGLRDMTMYTLGLHALQQGVNVWIQKGRDEYTKISQLANTEWVDFDGVTLSVRTKHLHMLHPDTEKYHNLGVMHITFKPLVGSSSLKVWNKTGTHSGYWAHCAHPHIEQGTGGCQGTLSSRLVSSFGAGDYADGIEQILFFLGTVNIDDVAGQKISNWPLSEGTINGVTFNRGVIA